MIDLAVRAWARNLVVANRRATVFLTLFAGIAAAASMTAWGYARRADTVVDRRVERFMVGDGAVNTCPPGIDPGVDLFACFDVEVSGPAYETLASSPFVEVASQVAGSQLALSTTPEGPTSTVFTASTVRSTGGISVPNVLAGRLVDDAATDEIMISETTSVGLDVGVGSTVWAAACEVDFSREGVCGTPVPLQVVGVTRSDRDLVPVRDTPPGLEDGDDDFGVITPGAWYREHGSEFGAFVQLQLRLVPGATLDDVRADLAARLPDGWTVLVGLTEDATVYDGLRQSTQLQGRALLSIALILGLAGAVFVGQAVVRQVRRELQDHDVMSALGMSTGQIVTSAVVRAVVIAVPASLLAVFVTVAASGLGPPGLAGNAEIDPGISIDAVVLVSGGLGVGVGIVAVVALCAWRLTRATSRPSVRVPPSALASVMTPTAGAGLVVGRAGRGGGGVKVAVIGTAAAVIGVVTAATLVDSLHAVSADPVKYGMSWHFAAGELADEAASEEAAARLIADPIVTDAAYVFSTGPVELDGVPAFWVVSFINVKGDRVAPVVVEGRAPIDDDEVAVAPNTLSSLGLHVGDTVDLPVLATGGASDPNSSAADVTSIGPLTIVGVVLVSDDDRTVGPGKGMVVTEATRQRMDPGVSPGMLVRTDPSVPPIEAARHLNDEFGSVTVPNPQADVGNLLLLDGTPWLIAWLVAALAVGALGHALVTLVRRGRREFGVLRALGFTRAQVIRTVCWQATGLAVMSLLIGLPLGVILGRWCWRLVRDQVGLANDPTLNWMVPALVAVAVIAMANAIAWVPAVRASRYDLAHALRTE